jgi:predicted membrane-bound dolichyl-phosphate-mannose-protein mannosyltransferase
MRETSGKPMFIGEYALILTLLLLKITICYTKNCKSTINLPYYALSLMNHLVGFSAALLLLFSPVFLAQIGIIYTEIPITAFAVMTVYFFLRKRAIWYLISAFLLFFTKENSVVIVFAILTIIFIQFLINSLRKRGNLKKDSKEIIKELFIYGSPLLLLAVWFVWHKISTGWMFVMPSYQNELMKRAFVKIIYHNNFSCK